MNEVSKRSVELVMNALEEFLQHIVKTSQFNLGEFVNFMEPRFAEAGYRTPPHSGVRGQAY